MSSTILFVFEGQKTENQIAESLTKYFVNENTNVQCAFCADIYQLYDKLYADEDLDTFAILKNRPQNTIILSSYERRDFAEIYMFFDYDGHATNANDETIKDLLKFFDEETKNGKLFISYPMVEAIKHLSSSIDFENLSVNAKVNISYKSMVSSEGSDHLKNLQDLSEDDWLEIIDAHLKKMNSIVNNSFTVPSSYIPQYDIFIKQKEKFIDVDSKVAVLSGFPIFLFDYYGFNHISSLLVKEEE